MYLVFTRASIGGKKLLPNNRNNSFNNSRPRPAQKNPPAPGTTSPGPFIKELKKDAIAVEGKITEALPNAMFQVALDNGHMCWVNQW